SENDVEAELKIEASAVDGETIVFAIELVYAGIFRLTNIPKENIQALSLIECPRLIFPFARQIVAEATRNGGFPPLMIDPIDFVALFRQQVASQAGPGQDEPPAGAAPN
ncbi:MAG: protein-export chaperone SecB, partial [Alphaproteobacteria bacterium]